MEILSRLKNINQLPHNQVIMAKSVTGNFLFQMLRSLGTKQRNVTNDKVTMSYTNEEKAQLLSQFQKTSQAITDLEQAGELNNLNNIATYFFLEGLELFSLAGIDTSKTYRLPNVEMQTDDFVAPLAESVMIDTTIIPIPAVNKTYSMNVREFIAELSQIPPLLDLIAEYALADELKVLVEEYVDWRKTQPQPVNEKLALLAYIINVEKLFVVADYAEFCLLVNLVHIEGYHESIKPLALEVFQQAAMAQKFIVMLKNRSDYANLVDHNTPLLSFLLTEVSEQISYKDYLRLTNLLKAADCKIPQPSTAHIYSYMPLLRIFQRRRLDNSNNFTLLANLLNEHSDFQTINTFQKFIELTGLLSLYEIQLPELLSYYVIQNKINVLSNLVKLIENDMFNKNLRKVLLASIFPMLLIATFATFIPLYSQAQQQLTDIGNMPVVYQNQTTTCLSAASDYPYFENYSDGQYCGFFRCLDTGCISGGLPAELTKCFSDCDPIDRNSAIYLCLSTYPSVFWVVGAFLLIGYVLREHRVPAVFEDLPETIRNIANIGFGTAEHPKPITWPNHVDIPAGLKFLKAKLTKLETKFVSAEEQLILALPENIAATMPNRTRTHSFTLFSRPSVSQSANDLAMPLLEISLRR